MVARFFVGAGVIVEVGEGTTDLVYVGVGVLVGEDATVAVGEGGVGKSGVDIAVGA